MLGQFSKNAFSPHFVGTIFKKRIFTPFWWVNFQKKRIFTPIWWVNYQKRIFTPIPYCWVNLQKVVKHCKIRLFELFSNTVTLFLFKLDKYTSECDIIQASTQRHLTRYFASSNGLDTNANHIHINGLNGIHFAGSLTEVELIMNNKRGCQKYPHKDMDEHCR